MTVTLFCVRATIAPEHEDAFNHWYNTDHVPMVLRYPGVVSARRYKQFMGPDKYQYMALYEFESEETFRKFLDSDHLKALLADYDKNFGTVSERDRFAYTQCWP